MPIVTPAATPLLTDGCSESGSMQNIDIRETECARTFVMFVDIVPVPGDRSVSVIRPKCLHASIRGQSLLKHKGYEGV